MIVVGRAAAPADRPAAWRALVLAVAQPRGRAVRNRARHVRLLGAAQRRCPARIRAAAPHAAPADRWRAHDRAGQAGAFEHRLDENLAAALALRRWSVHRYPVPRPREAHRFVRFHAMQSTVAFLGARRSYYLLSTVCPIFGRSPGILRSWARRDVGVADGQGVQGKRYKLPYIGDWAETDNKSQG